MGLRQVSNEFWGAVKNNIKVFDEIKDWAEVIYGNIQPVIDDPEYINLALNLIPEGDFNELSWQNWTETIKEKSGRKGKKLFMPLRLSITGKDFGPEMAKLLPLIGKEKTLSRLNGRAS